LMVSCIKKLLPKAQILDPKIPTPSLQIRNNIFVDLRLKIDNKEIIVEYNGAQHYQPITFGNTSISESKINFTEQVQRDQWLRNHCIKKNIILIEINGMLIKNGNIKLYLINELLKLGLLNKSQTAELAKNFKLN